MTHSLRRFTTAASLLGLLAAAVVLTVGTPGRVEGHHLCGNTGSPFGPFDLQTYEHWDYRNAYSRTMDLAGYNWLFPERPTFALPPLETGGREYGSGWLTAGYIPPVLLKSIAWIESGWAQASYDPPVQYGQIGPVLSSHDCGYGITQVTSGMQNVSGVPTPDQAMIGGHFAFNIARGARILAEKWNAAPEFRPLVGIRNVSVIEDWYYALWGYNGFAFKNHPLNPDYSYPRPMYNCSSARTYPYQELIMGCAANPPSRGGARLWNPQPVQLPNLSDPAFYNHLRVENWNPCAQNFQCAAMDMPTPNPWNQDPTVPRYSRSEVFGDPSIALSNWNLEFVAPPGGQSPNQLIAIGNWGSGVLAWRLQASAPWINVSRGQGISLGSDLNYTHQVVAIRADASNLLPGTHTAQITIESLWAAAPATITVTVHTGDGALLNPSDGRIYLYQGGLKRHIPDPATFEANGYSWNRVISVPPEWAAGIPTGHALPSVLANGRLLRPPGGSVPIYVMENGAKRHVTNPDVFTQCGYAWDSVPIVSSSTVNSIPNGPTLNGHPCPRVSLPDGTLIAGTHGRVWVMRANTRKWVTNPTSFADCRYLWGNLNRVPDGLVAQFPEGPPVTGCTAEGSLILTPDGKVHVILAGTAHHIPDALTLGAYGYDGNRITPVALATAPAGVPLLSVLTTGSLVRAHGGVPTYVIDGGVKRHVSNPDVFNSCGYSWAAVTILSPGAIDSIPTGSVLTSGPCPRLPLPDGTLIYGPEGAVWVTMGQTRKWVTSWAAISDCGYNLAGLVPVSAALLAHFAQTQPVSSCTAAGSLLAREGKIYLVIWGGAKRHVPNPATFEAARLSWSAVTPLQQDLLVTGRPLLDVVATGRLVRPAGDQVPIYVMESGIKRHIVSPAVLDACGYSWAAVSQLPAATVATFSVGPPLSSTPCPQPTFSDRTLLVGSEGKVWVVQGGQRRWVTSPDVFLACGYWWANLDVVADSIINALPPGPNVTGAPCV